MAHIVVMGEILVEMVALERDQSLARAGQFEGPFPAGAPAIFADQAARLGVPTAMVGCVGADAFGDAVLGRLQQDGVDVNASRRVPDLATGTAFVTYRSDGSRSFIFHLANSAAGRVTEADVDAASFDDCRFFHVMGCSLFSGGMVAAARHGIRRARAAGAKVSFDPNVRPELIGSAGMRAVIDELMASADVLLPGDADLGLLFPETDPEAVAANLVEHGASAVLLKCGARGTVYFDRNQRIVSRAFAVTEVDPTGAGDCAGATFIASLVEGLPIEQSLRRANAAGALAVSRRGAMEGNSSPAELEAFLRARG